MLAILSSLLLGYMITYGILLPVMKLRKVRAQGFKTYYFPVIGKYFYSFLDFLKYGDFHHSEKRMLRKNPNLPGFAYNLGSMVCLHLTDEDLIKEYGQKEHLFVKDQELLEYLFFLIGDGLVKSHGQTWKNHRRILSKFFQFDLLNSSIPLIQRIVQEYFSKIPSTVGYEIISKLDDITARIILNLFINEDVDEASPNSKSLDIELKEIV
jgi:hypothetical protein